MELPDYSEAQEVFAQAGFIVSPAESHGILCGLLIKDSATPVARYVQMVSNDPNSSASLKKEGEELLRNLYRTTIDQLHDPNLGLELLLPDDDEPLDFRIHSACKWAKGLIVGLAEQGVTSIEELPEDTADFYRDCLALAGNEYEVDDDSMENEQLYMELQEFLRMGTLVSQEELQPIKAPPQLH
ncbi:MAG: UPF0149 family protein [Thiotrichales bacterium]